jgi:hypothetical protein
MSGYKRFPRLLTAILVFAFAGVVAGAGDLASDMKKAGKSIAKAATTFGHDVAKTSKHVGESIGDATADGAKTAWYKTKDWATHESKRVADATARYWDDAIRGKEATRDQLRRENESLKAKDKAK